jgi:CDP-diacylglycerol pyrophosphatase
MTSAARRLLLAVLLAGLAPSVRAADPSALWHIVHDRCVPDEQAKQDPAPCAAVDLAHGFAVLKDRDGATQYLLIPTARVGGIEDPAILAPNAPNYWDAAWAARHFVEERAGHPLPPDVLSLAINSVYGRTQDQLHIHIDCIRPDVRAALAQYVAEIGPQWSDFPVPLAGHRYRALRLPGVALDGTNPFRLLAAGVPPAEMASHTLVLAGVTVAPDQPGLVLLDDKADLPAGDRASGETLQDHDCVLAR